jgi:hypothetical protein
VTAQAVRVSAHAARPARRPTIVGEQRGWWPVGWRADAAVAVVAGALMGSPPGGHVLGSVAALLGLAGAIGVSLLWVAVLRGVAQLRLARLPGLPLGLPIGAATRLSRLARRSLMVALAVGFVGVALSRMPAGLPANLAAGAAAFLAVGALRACAILRVFARTPVLEDQ